MIAPLPARRRAALALVAASTVLLAACGDDETGTSTSSESSPETTSSSAASASTSARTSTSSSPRKAPSAGLPKATSCVASTRDAMTTEQQVGQLLMVALDPGSGATGLDSQIRDLSLGNMLYLGGWTGHGTVTAASAHLQQVAPTVGGTRVGLLVAADQEGGQVQQLKGDGFSTLPSGVDQGQMSPAALRSAAKGWGGELASAGVNVNLAPVADTVPAEIGRANGPIGQWGRQYGGTPQAAGQGAVAFAQGMLDAKVQPTVKHFPGIGRITGNTDSTADGIIDRTATTKDPYLQPFVDGVEAGTRIVMISNASYPQLDADHQAPFSTKIITGLLRKQLDFDQVVITDDVGVAKAVSAVPVGERATRFVDAGGDIVLTADPQTTPTMHAALVGKAKGDEKFAGKVAASVTRVLTLKEKMGLLSCGG